jgi:hypothetical protein
MHNAKFSVSDTLTSNTAPSPTNLQICIIVPKNY